MTAIFYTDDEIMGLWEYPLKDNKKEGCKFCIAEFISAIIKEKQKIMQDITQCRDGANRVVLCVTGLCSLCA